MGGGCYPSGGWSIQESFTEGAAFELRPNRKEVCRPRGTGVSVGWPRQYILRWSWEFCLQKMLQPPTPQPPRPTPCQNAWPSSMPLALGWGRPAKDWKEENKIREFVPGSLLPPASEGLLGWLHGSRHLLCAVLSPVGFL